MRRFGFHLAFLLFCAPSVLQSHDYGPQRAAVFGKTDTGWTILFTYTEPPGEKSERLRALYDSDQDGELSGLETERLSPILEKRGLAGLRFEPSPDWSTARRRIRYHRREGLSIALLLEHRDDFSISVDDKSVPIEFIVKSKSGRDIAKKTVAPGENVKIVR